MIECGLPPKAEMPRDFLTGQPWRREGDRLVFLSGGLGSPQPKWNRCVMGAPQSRDFSWCLICIHRLQTEAGASSASAGCTLMRATIKFSQNLKKHSGWDREYISYGESQRNLESFEQESY